MKLFDRIILGLFLLALVLIQGAQLRIFKRIYTVRPESVSTECSISNRGYGVKHNWVISSVEYLGETAWINRVCVRCGARDMDQYDGIFYKAHRDDILKAEMAKG